MTSALRLFAVFCICLFSTGAEASERKRKNSTRTKVHAHCVAGQTRFDLLVSTPAGPYQDFDADTLWVRQRSKRAVALKTELEVPKQPKFSAGSICDTLTVVDAGSGNVLIGLVVDDRPNWDATLVFLYDLKNDRLLDTQQVPTARRMSVLDEHLLLIHQTDTGEGSACHPPTFKDAAGRVDCASMTLGAQVLVRGEGPHITMHDDLARTWAARTDMQPFFSGASEFGRFFGFDESRGFTAKDYVGVFVGKEPRCLRRRENDEWNCRSKSPDKSH